MESRDNGRALVQVGQAPPLALSQASSDAHLVELWLSGKAEKTARAYRSDVSRFLSHLGDTPLRVVTLGDVQSFADTLSHLRPASQARTLGAVKSLLSFGCKLGYMAFNVGAVVKLPKVKDTLAERILTEGEVWALLRGAPGVRGRMPARNRALLRFLYYSAARVSEACGLRWRDLQERDNGMGQVTLFGKGGKTRFVLLPAKVWAEVRALRNGSGPDAPVFRSNKQGALDAAQVLRIVRQAAAAAGIDKPVSPHWLRHAHASHAARKAPLHVVQATLGHASPATTGRYLHVSPNDSSALYLAEC